MKYSHISFGFYSLIISLSALVIYFYNNYTAYELYFEIVETYNDDNAELITGVVKFPLIFAIVALIFGILGLANKKRFSKAGISLSLLTIVFSIFPVWTFFI